MSQLILPLKKKDISYASNADILHLDCLIETIEHKEIYDLISAWINTDTRENFFKFLCAPKCSAKTLMLKKILNESTSEIFYVDGKENDKIELGAKDIENKNVIFFDHIDYANDDKVKKIFDFYNYCHNRQKKILFVTHEKEKLLPRIKDFVDLYDRLKNIPVIKIPPPSLETIIQLFDEYSKKYQLKFNQAQINEISIHIPKKYFFVAQLFSEIFHFIWEKNSKINPDNIRSIIKLIDEKSVLEEKK